VDGLRQRGQTVRSHGGQHQRGAGSISVRSRCRTVSHSRAKA
jgi:hypothetical protein